MPRARPTPTTIGATQGPEGALVDLPGIDPEAREVEEARLTGVDFEGAKLRGLRLVDVEAERVVAANGDWGGGLLRRTRFQDARLTHHTLAEAKVEDSHFVGCKLDYANFRFAAIEHVSFEDCVLDNADFQGARLYAVRFEGCRLNGTDFTKAELAHVDLRGSELILGGSVLGLRGAIVDPLQLMELSRPIAHELGIVVKED
ncbi:MAG TPA: pentapeptide repeat-containing protein [Solirubrobacterales bacterium]|nr:pentapeptide repeat-containing protein [Solirubrobacterales bacterium]